LENEFLKEYFKLDEINEWDLAYYYTKLKKEKYSLDDKEVKKYFEFESVLVGLHSIVGKIF
jgi:Zn-dependent oligopeptidase